MPIILNKVDDTNISKIATPRFFDSSKIHLTGKGAVAGVLCEMRNPIHTPHNKKTDKIHVDPFRRNRIAPDLETSYIPMFVISSSAWECIDEIPLPTSNKDCIVATDAYGVVEWHMRAHVHSITAEKDTSKPKGQQGKRITHPVNLTVTYRIDLTRVVDTNDNRSKVLHTRNVHDAIAEYRNSTSRIFTQNVPAAFESIMNNLERAGQIVNRNNVADYLRDLSLYNLVCERSQAWQETLDEECKPLFESLANKTSKDVIAGRDEVALRECVHRLESYSVPLDIYARIYQDIKDNFTPSAVSELCKENLNIMLSNLMEKLKNNKNTLINVPQVPGVCAAGDFNSQQKAAIESTAPLNLVQATAGSGKTKTITGRIQYMIATGIKPEDIVAITFTNAAADNVTEKNPGVKSMTIDSFICAVYQNNFTTQNIATSSTMANGLDVYFPKNIVAQRLRDLIIQVDNNIEGSFTQLNRYIEQHIVEVINMCETIGHVTLSMAIVLCYQLIDRLTEPDEVKASHMIVDEVQDTSIFQFIYTLEHVNKYKQSLFMVGDPSQTLFEFRFANPRALNVMQNSGVFDAFKLDINYRSRQEILDLANTTLENIEANQSANLRLQSNDLTAVTEDSFTDSVHVDYIQVQNLKEIQDNMTNFVRSRLSKYINECLNRNESITFLAGTHKELKALRQALETLWPNCSQESLAPERGYDSNVLSRFVKMFWNDVRFLPSTNLLDAMQMLMIAKVGDLEPQGLRPQYQWKLDSAKEIIKDWHDDGTTQVTYIRAKTDYDQGLISQTAFFDEIKKTLFDYESAINVKNQLRISIQNNLNKEKVANSDTNFKTSTIHSAKGLEFDNVVIIYRDNSNMPESDKRMYYVALTRAMRTEFILAYEKHPAKASQILLQYDTCVERLRNNNATNNPAIITD